MLPSGKRKLWTMLATVQPRNLRWFRCDGGVVLRCQEKSVCPVERNLKRLNGGGAPDDKGDHHVREQYDIADGYIGNVMLQIFPLTC